ncbi:MAG: F0F1 ATP synthase subunit A, partial [Bacteroidales bacterium]|nr:F0F1 ATP synthase subunit A [Bacteroidales bacterium]
MRRFRYILLLLALLLSPQLMFAEEEKHEELNVQEIIFEHMLDSYSWHVTKIGEKDIVIYLPVILYSKT